MVNIFGGIMKCDTIATGVIAAVKEVGLDRPLVDHLVRRTEGLADRANGLPFTGDHLNAVCRGLKRQALRTGIRVFSTDDLDRALQRKTRRPVVLSAHEEHVIAVHEAGHAVLAMVVPGARPPEKITIASDMDGALGYVLRAARARPYATNAGELRAEICVGLGGIEAERLVFDDVSIGAYTDLQQATAIARAMAEGHGMTVLGPRVVMEGCDPLSEQLSDQRRGQIDDTIDALLAVERDRARALLAAGRKADALAEVEKARLTAPRDLTDELDEIERAAMSDARTGSPAGT